jgi:hypothetical protein
LLYERINLDLFIFALVVIATSFYGKMEGIPSIILLVITCLMKFYTLPIFLILLLSEKNKLKRIILLGVFIFLFSYIVFVVYIPGISRSLEAGSPFGSFGIKVLGDSLSQLTGVSAFSYSNYILLIAFFVVFVKRSLELKFWKFENLFIQTADLVAYSFLSVFLTIYFSNINYDYRLIFLIPCILIPGIFSIRFVFGFLSVFCLSINLGGVQVVGDIIMVYLVYELICRFTTPRNSQKLERN